MYKVGLDVHKASITGAIIDMKGNLHSKCKFKNSIGEMFKFVELLTPELTEVGMESGTYIYPLYDALVEKGFNVKIAHAKKLRRITESCNKNDDKDAEHIARQLLVNDFPESFILNKEQRENRELIRMRIKIVQEQTRTKNRIRMFLARFNINIKSTSPFTNIGIKELQELELPMYAKRSLDILIRELVFVKKEIKQIDKELELLAEKLPEAKLLRTVPSIGSFSSLTFLVELAEWKRFKNVKNLSAYIGMIPKMSGSGNKMYFGRMRFDGNKAIRYAFNRAAEHAVKMKNNEFYEYFKRLYPKKKRRTAVAAVAHKMLRVCYGVLKSGEPYKSGF
jgi:transposase